MFQRNFFTSFETSVPIYQTTLSHITEDHTCSCHCCGYLTSEVGIKIHGIVLSSFIPFENFTEFCGETDSSVYLVDSKFVLI